MAFSDPLSTLTINGTAHTMTRINTGSVVGKFTNADGTVEIQVDPRGTQKRKRRTLKLYIRENVTDPYTGLVRQEQYMIAITDDRPVSGIVDQKALDAVIGLTAWGAASTNSNYKKLFAGEN